MFLRAKIFCFLGFILEKVQILKLKQNKFIHNFCLLKTKQNKKEILLTIQRLVQQADQVDTRRDRYVHQNF